MNCSFSGRTGAGRSPEMQGWMSLGLQDKIQKYWLQGNGEAMTSGATAELEYIAKKYGYYNSDALLREAGLAMQQGQPQPQQQQQSPLAAFGAQP